LPVLLLGRLAVDKNYHNQGIGQALLRDAMLKFPKTGRVATLGYRRSRPAFYRFLAYC
jgi:predicted N-acetyltransferase YhbS